MVGDLFKCVRVITSQSTSPRETLVVDQDVFFELGGCKVGGHVGLYCFKRLLAVSRRLSERQKEVVRWNLKRVRGTISDQLEILSTDT